MRNSVLILVLLAWATIGIACSKDEGRSTIHKAADDVETEIEGAPETAEQVGEDVDETARGIVGNEDEPAETAPAPPAGPDPGKK